jgi:hypothetical protein
MLRQSRRATLWTSAAAAATFALAVTLSARAEPQQSRTLYNEKGQEVGRSITRPDGSTTYKDSMGREVGRSERRGDSTNYYDALGRSLGSSRGTKNERDGDR